MYFQQCLIMVLVKLKQLNRHMCHSQSILHLWLWQYCLFAWLLTSKLIEIRTLCSSCWQRFVQYLASRNTLFNLSNFLDKSGLQGRCFQLDTSLVIQFFQTHLSCIIHFHERPNPRQMQTWWIFQELIEHALCFHNCIILMLAMVRCGVGGFGQLGTRSCLSLSICLSPLLSLNSLLGPNMADFHLKALVGLFTQGFSHVNKLPGSQHSKKAAGESAKWDSSLESLSRRTLGPFSENDLNFLVQIFFVRHLAVLHHYPTFRYCWVHFSTFRYYNPYLI